MSGPAATFVLTHSIVVLRARVVCSVQRAGGRATKSHAAYVFAFVETLYIAGMETGALGVDGVAVNTV